MAWCIGASLNDHKHIKFSYQVTIELAEIVRIDLLQYKKQQKSKFTTSSETITAAWFEFGIFPAICYYRILLQGRISKLLFPQSMGSAC